MSARQLVLASACVATLSMACRDVVVEPSRMQKVNQRSRVVTDPSPLGLGVNMFDPPRWDSIADSLGITFQPTYADHPTYINWAKKAGVKWIKVDFTMDPWGALADTLRIRHTVQLAEDNGLSILGILMDGAHVFPDSATWYNFVASTVGAWGHRVFHWEIWNEANDVNHLSENGASVTGGRYATLVNWVADTIRGRGNYVVGGSVTWLVPGARQFLLDAVAVAGAKMDIVSYHVYETDAAAALADIADAEDAISPYPHPLWLTEFGGMVENLGPESNVQVISLVARRTNSLTYRTKKVFAWHHFQWNNTYDLSENAWTFALLRPTNVSTGANGRPRYSSPVPRSAFWAYLKGALYNCPVDAADCRPTFGSTALPVHRWRAGASGHLYSLNPNEVTGVPGWNFERLNVFYVRNQTLGDPTDARGLAPLHQCWSPDGHLLTQSSTCEGRPGFSHDRLLGYVSQDSVPGMRRLTRMYRSSTTDWYTVTCEQERLAAVATGYVFDAFLGFVFSGDCPPDVQAVHRWNAWGDHFYSVEPNELTGVSPWVKDANSPYFNVRSWPTAGHTRPVYQCWMSTAHYLALSTTCDGRGGGIHKTLGFVSPSPSIGLVPLYLLYHSGATDYLATTCSSVAGYSQLTVLGYVQRLTTHC